MRNSNTQNSFSVDNDGHIRLKTNLSPKDLGIQNSDTFVVLIVDDEAILVKMELELKAHVNV
mgnify:CR=1 FL=1|jgi:hypothetical protein